MASAASDSSSGAVGGSTTGAEGSGDATGADGSAGSSSTGPGGLGEGEECDLHHQDCAPGLKCMPYADDGDYSWDSTICVPIHPDPVGLGEPCQWFGGDLSGHDDCGFGQFCSPYVAETPVCRDLCRSDEGSYNWEDLYCPTPMQHPTTCQECFCWCEPSCDPLVPETCAADQVCILDGYGQGFRCATDASGELGAYGDPCEYVNACDPGLVCLAADAVPGCEGLGCCAPFCEFPSLEPCPGAAEGEVCQPWWGEEPAPAGYENLGVCALPT